MTNTTNQRRQVQQPPPPQDPVINLPRNIDPKMPITWLFGLAGGLALLLATIWFQSARMQDELRDLKIEVKTWNATAGTFASDISMLKFRADTIDADLRSMRSDDRRDADRRPSK